MIGKDFSMRLGRNDPCPCGSGKKYKKCCLLKEKTSTTVLTHRLLRETDDRVSELLLPFAKKIYGEESLFEAWDTFWSDMAGDLDLDNPFLQLFTPWFMYHWFPEEYDNGRVQYPSEHTLVARFLKESSWKVDSFTKRFLEVGRTEPLTFWQVEAVEPNKGLLLKDLFAEREYFVHEISATRTIKKFDIVLCQVIGLDGEYILSGTGPYPLTPSRFRERITTFANQLKKSGGHSIKPIELLGYDIDFIACYEDCVKELLNPPLPELRNTDGEELVFTTSRYTFNPENRTDIIEKLKSMWNIEHHGDEEDEEAEFVWVAEGKNKPMESITRGHITVGSDYIETECNSEKRDTRLKDRLIRNLRDWIEYRVTSHKPFDMENIPESDEPQGSGLLDVDTLPGEARQQLVEMMEKQYMGWADERIPALQNKTPKEAVKTKAGREKVIGLINDWENSQLRMPNPQFQFDFNKLREELGLEAE